MADPGFSQGMRSIRIRLRNLVVIFLVLHKNNTPTFQNDIIVSNLMIKQFL